MAREALLCVMMLIGLFGLSACGPGLYTREGYVFGTLVQITINDSDQSEQAASAVFQTFEQMQHLLHARQDSELAKVNAAMAQGKTPIQISDALKVILLDATRYAKQTHHTFNPAIGRLIEYWGFHRDTYKPHIPDASQIATLLRANPSMEDIDIQGNRLFCRNNAVQIDLGGYAKGLALDRAAETLKKYGVKNALINIGGNVLAMGKKNAQPWTVAIRDPRSNGVFAVVHLRDNEAIGTSGDYQRFFEVDGKRYHHLLDPKTGYPARQVAGVTVIVRGQNAGVRSDVLTKPFFIDGLPRYLDDASDTQINTVIFTDLNGRHWASPAMQERIRLLSGRQTAVIPLKKAPIN